MFNWDISVCGCLMKCWCLMEDIGVCLVFSEICWCLIEDSSVCSCLIKCVNEIRWCLIDDISGCWCLMKYVGV